MKIAKNYSDVPTIYYKPEIALCLTCNTPLKRSHRIWNKYIHQLSGTIHAVSMGYDCPNGCSEIVYRSAEAESLALKYYSFGIDVIAQIGELRFDRNQTISEIHAELTPQISISEREIQYLIETYMLLVTGVKQDKNYLDKVINKEGLILSIDGIQPDKGNEVLYILRDVLSGEVLGAENLLSSDTESIKGIIQPVIALGYPILGVISDGQQSIRLAVTALMSDVPYQLCHYHYLDGISQGLQEADRKLKTELKKGIRDIRRVERDIEHIQPPAEREIFSDLALTIRTTALAKSVSPFDCGGITIYDQLVEIESTLTALEQVKSHPVLTRLKTIVQRYRSHEAEYHQVCCLNQLVKRIATLIDKDRFGDDSEWKRKQRLLGYMGYLTKLKKDHPQLAAEFARIIKVTKSFLPGLFAFIRCPQLPTTNNDLEIFHRQVKAKHRRRTGRKSSHDYIIRYGRFAVYQTGHKCTEKIKDLAYSKFKALKEQLGTVTSRCRKMYQIRHRTSEFLSRLLNRWKTAPAPPHAPT